MLERFKRECVQEIAMETLRRVIGITPVGKKPKLKGNRTVTVTTTGSRYVQTGTGTIGYQVESKRKRKYLTARAARFEEIWKGYVGGTLRRGWTAKSVSEAEKR